MTAAAILVSVPILAGSFFTYMWWNTKRQMDIAVEKHRSQRISSQNMFRVPERLSHIPSALPVIDEILLDSLEQLKVTDSVIFEKLDLDRLLLPTAR